MTRNIAASKRLGTHAASGIGISVGINSRFLTGISADPELNSGSAITVSIEVDNGAIFAGNFRAGDLDVVFDALKRTAHSPINKKQLNRHFNSSYNGLDLDENTSKLRGCTYVISDNNCPRSARIDSETERAADSSIAGDKTFTGESVPAGWLFGGCHQKHGDQTFSRTSGYGKHIFEPVLSFA